MIRKMTDAGKSAAAIAAAAFMLAGFGGLPAAAVPAAGNDEVGVLKQTSRAFSAIAQKAIPAVVFIKVEKTIPGAFSPGQSGMRAYPFDGGDVPDGDLFEFFFRGRGRPRMENRPFRVLGQGTGFIVSKDGSLNLPGGRFKTPIFCAIRLP